MNRNRFRQKALKVCHAEKRITVTDTGEIFPLYAEEFANFIVPPEGVYIKKLRPGSIGIIGLKIAGKFENKPTVDCTRAKILISFSFRVIEYPGDLGGGKIRRKPEPRTLPDYFFDSGILPAKSFTDFLPPGALPHHGVVQGPPAFPFPDKGRFPLVGNTDSGKGRRIYPRPAYRFSTGGKGIAVDFLRVMGNPAFVRYFLFVSLVVSGNNTAFTVKNQRLCSGGTLIDGQDEGLHARFILPGERLSLLPHCCHTDPV
jgi:hypothetical protein